MALGGSILRFSNAFAGPNDAGPDEANGGDDQMIARLRQIRRRLPPGSRQIRIIDDILESAEMERAGLVGSPMRKSGNGMAQNLGMIGDFLGAFGGG